MRDISSTTSRRKQETAGFTLVEILVIAPLIMLMLAGFIALMINMTGDLVASTGRSKLMYAAGNMYETMRADVERSILFPNQSFTPNSPQGFNPSGGVDANGTSTPQFSGNQAFPTKWYFLILRQIATDKNPLDPTRQIIYKKNADGSCSTDPYLLDVVYFPTTKVISTPAGPYNANRWWRRVILDPTSTPCTTPWQKSTCAEGQTAPICKATDQEWGTTGYDTGITIPSIAFVFLDIPNPSDLDNTTPDGQQWIHPYNDGVAPCTSNKPAKSEDQIQECLLHSSDPYSPTTGRNARQVVVVSTLVLGVAGRNITYWHYMYANRGGP